MPPAYAELATTSNFSFLRAASHPDELVERAAALGHATAAIADRNTLAGIVRAHVAAKAAGIPLAVGARLVFGLGLGLGLGLGIADDGARRRAASARLSVLAYATDVASYGRLCRLLTLGKRRAPKGACHLDLHDLLDHEEGLLLVVVPPRVPDQRFVESVEGLARHVRDDRLSIAACRSLDGDDAAQVTRLGALSDHLGIPLAAVNDARCHDASRRALLDVVTCIRTGRTLEEAGRRIGANGERRLKSPAEMAALFHRRPEALARSVAIARRAAAFSLDELAYRYPDEVCPPGVAPMEHLVALTRAGAARRYPGGPPPSIAERLEHEFRLVDELEYAPYFLTVHEIVAFARSRGILCQGRGAAANSAICYCLGLTAVDPTRVDLLFERFISRERDEPPDIDIDFEHERREEVIQHVYGKYGRDRAALTAEVITYRGRSAIREVGKALGMPLDLVDRLAKDVDWWSDRGARPARIRAMGLDPADPMLARASALVDEILGFPRHLSQHVGGFVITRGPLCELVPVENAAMADRTTIEWDKDDVDAMGMLKVDLLGLGMLTCVRKAFDLVADHHGRRYELATVPAEDDAVFDMICEADTVGVFQIESRAQMTMLPRLRPRTWYDLVIEVAIVRPGPIQGKMVHPYLRRRTGEEPVSYPSPEVERVLAKTLGVPLFQEQAMSLAIVAAGFTAGEADALRRAMAAWKRRGNAIDVFEAKFLAGMRERGYAPDFARRCFDQIKGFGEYGFPESHAASFALIVWVSSWLKRRHPAAFAAALLNSQPMGFYAPAQIVRDAEAHGVPVRPVDVNRSAWDCTLEPIDPTGGDGAAPGRSRSGRSAWNAEARPVHALRLGLRLVRGLRREEGDRVRAAVVAQGPFGTPDALWRAAEIPASALRRLASADAFGSMGLDRPRAQWTVRRLRDAAMPLFDEVLARRGAVPRAGEGADLPPVPPIRRTIRDYEATGLSLAEHPIAFLRAGLAAEGATPAEALADEATWPHGRDVAVAGLVLVRQRPATAQGIIFMTIEDETGIANLILRPAIYERFRRDARHGRIVLARGRVERQGRVVHVLVASIERRDEAFGALAARSRDFR